jgi:hypothetical protein
MENKENVFQGNLDARQAGEIKHSRFRPRYRALSEDEKALHDEIKNKAVEMEQLYAKVCGGRYNSLALTSLEESVMWIVKELTGTGMVSNHTSGDSQSPSEAA